MKSEVDCEENEESKGEVTGDSNDRSVLNCFSCNFETVNIDELDEHILVSHEEEDVVNPDQKFQIVAEEVPELPYNIRKRQLEASLAQSLPKNIPRAKIIFKKHDSKFRLCKDTKFSASNDSPGPAKRAKRTPTEEMQCYLCSFVTRKKSVLATHMLNHSDVIPPVFYKCSQCPYQTKRKNDMPKHMLGHCSNVVMYNCSECPYQTKRKCDLPKHILCHKRLDSVPLYKCTYCPYVTKRKGDLPKHEMNHVERDKIFSWNCTECEYSSKRKNDLHKHMLVHSDRHLTGVYKCLKCAYASDKVVKFSRHVLSRCSVWDEPVSLEHLMLEDILASVDKSGVHVMLDADPDDVHDNSITFSEGGGSGVQYVECSNPSIEDSNEPVIIEGEIVEEQFLQGDSNGGGHMVEEGQLEVQLEVNDDEDVHKQEEEKQVQQEQKPVDPVEVE